MTYPPSTCARCHRQHDAPPHHYPLVCSCGHKILSPFPPAPDPDPTPDAPADVLIVYHRGDPWHRAIMLDQPAAALRAAGLSVGAINSCDASPLGLSAAILRRGSRLVINQALALPASTLKPIAHDHPNVRLLTTLHSSIGDLARSPQWIASLHAHAVAAAELTNVDLATPDDDLRRALPALDLVYLPNPVTIPDHDPRPPGDAVSLICDARPLKNWTTQIAALALAQRTYKPLPVLLAIHRARPETLRQFCETVGLTNYRLEPWRSHAAYLEMIDRDVRFALQASHTETFNYVAIEHLIRGRPVIGSPALPYLPAYWVADADSVHAIADRIGFVYAHPREAIATKLGRDIARTNNRRFLQTVEALLCNSGLPVPAEAEPAGLRNC